MKKIIAMFLCTFLTLVLGAACADQISLGGGYTVIIPAGYTMETGVTDRGESYTLYYNGAVEMYLYAENTDGASLDELVREIAAESSAIQQGTTPINGIDAGYVVAPYTDEEGTYINILYILPTQDQTILVDFYITKESDSQQTADIMNTLSGGSAPGMPAVPSGNRIAAGNTGFTLLLPDSLTSDELSNDEISDGVIAVYVNDEMDVTLCVFDAEGCSANALTQQYASELGGTFGGQIQCGALTMSCCSGSYTEDGDAVAYEIYTSVVNDQALILEFYWDGDTARPAEIDAVLSSIR